MTDEAQISDLVTKVQANKKYQTITQSMVKRLCEDAISKGLTGKSAVKAVRNKLHQVAGSYIKQSIDYPEAYKRISKLPEDMHSEEVRQFSLKTMQAHASTAERLPILEEFFNTCLAPIAPVHSVLDLACGLNPLAIPWMPLAKGATYNACDIYEDMLSLINTFFRHFNLPAEANPCDLLDTLPKQKTQVVFLLKTLPCLEQVDKEISLRLLEAIPSNHILVSFPARSLSGRQKGMPDFYRDHFHDLLSGKNWQVREFAFSTELAFLVTK